jgi:Na+-transporting NADH:ubiquinone oxidoreductase subunit A
MSQSIKIRKGVNIRLSGKASAELANAGTSEEYALKPSDFHGLTPKLLLKEGAEVKAGTPVFYNKNREQVLFSSPVSGTISEIVRGEKRVILEVKIRPSASQQFEEYGSTDLTRCSREELIAKMLKAGMWPLIQQRPFAVVANPLDNPKAVFVSTFDSAPLAPDSEFILKGKEADFQAGIDALVKLGGNRPVHLGLKDGSKAFSSFKGVNAFTIGGPHPAGNVGVQIHHVNPINKGEVIWYQDFQDVIALGRFIKTGHVDLRKVIALTGSEAKDRKYFEVVRGSKVSSITKGRLNSGDIRIISGNVLTGKQISENSFIGFYDQQITVIPEGKDPRFFLTKGWLGPGFDKFSLSRAFPTWLIGKKEYALDTNQNGEERAFVFSGQYEEVFPFDIYPVHLVKSIIVNDIEQMENLGIYEVAPEDFALCEYVCTSKIPVQKIVREGLDAIMEEFK